MTIEEIKNMKLEDSMELIESRLRSKTPDAEAFSQEEIEEEFGFYKDELIAIETERLRIADLRDRLAKLSDHNAAHMALNPDVPNKSVWFRKNVIENADKSLSEANMAALEAADAELKGARSLVEYRELRAKEYPSLADQLDKIYHDGIDAWKDEILAIKEKYPKPE